MSRVVVISGTPKARASVSGTIIGRLTQTLGTPVATYRATTLIRPQGMSTALADIVDADVLVFVFPLYVDALPAPLVNVLTQLERAFAAESNRPRVYAVCNCGFLDATHTRLALAMVESFCHRAGLAWRYGVGVGGGAFLASQTANMAPGLAANVFAALDALAHAIARGEGPRDNVFVQPRLPGVFYRLAANADWRRQAKAHHADKMLKARPYAT